MRIGRRLLHLAAFFGLSAATAISLGRIMQPPITRNLVLVAAVAVVAGAPGLIHRRLSPLSLVLLPLGLYVLIRLAVPLPPQIDGWQAQYRFYAGELHYGMAAYANDVFPLTLAGVPGLRLLILVWEFVVVGVAATLTLGVRRPLLGAGMLLAVLGASLTVDASSGDRFLAGAFLLFTVLVLVTAQGLSRRRWGVRDALAGLGLGGIGILVAIAVLSSQPGLVHQGWEDWREWDPFGPGSGGGTVFNWRQNYPRLLDPGNNEPVMRVTSPLPTYWKATTLEAFTGSGWASNAAFSYRVPDRIGPRPIHVPEPVPPGDEVTLRFDLSAVTTSYLFSGGRPTSLTLDSPSPVWASETGALSTSQTIKPPMSYRLTAVIPRARPAQLVGLGRNYPSSYQDSYMRLPMFPAEQVRQNPALEQEWKTTWSPRYENDDFRDIYALNRTIVGDATDPYEQTLRIERYLRANFHYSLQVPPSSFMSPIAAFLFDTHTGYCQHFAGAMALLLRLNGIPSRVAVGFITGNLVDKQTYEVTTNNAHSWVEAYFPGQGWLPFDPTPGRRLPLAGASSTSPGFTDPFPHDPSNTNVTTTPTIPDARDRLPQDVRVPGTKTARVSLFSRVLVPLAGVLALSTILAAWPALRRRVRERGLRKGTPAERLAASVRLLRADLAGWGLPVTDASTLDEVAVMAGSAGADILSPVTERAQAIFFGGYAASSGDVRTAERARRRVVTGLRRERNWLWTVCAWYGLSGIARRLSVRVAGTHIVWMRRSPAS